jgi:predicted dehydrogenase
MGLVGAGFVGVHHVDAVRRLGFVDVVAIADASDDAATRRAREYGVSKAYGDFRALVADPAIDVVHVTTPNFLHAPVIRAALEHGKHVISEKPLAMTAAEARELRDAAHAAGVVHAVTFNYRGNPMVQQARDMVAQGELGDLHFIHGAYLQDWLLEKTDYSWRLEPDKGGRSSAFADIGSHWCDLAQHIAGARIESVLADLTTVVNRRLRPAKALTFSQHTTDEAVEEVVVTSEDLATVLLRFEGGIRGCVTIGQVCAGHKNDLWLEVNGRQASVRWRQEQQNELWVGSRKRPNAVLTKDPSFMGATALPYVHLPGGHQQGWPDALANVFRDVYGSIARGATTGDPKPPALATFDDGYRAACIVEAILESHAAGSTWIKVPT